MAWMKTNYRERNAAAAGHACRAQPARMGTAGPADPPDPAARVAHRGRHCHAYGEHELTLEDPPEVTLRTVPRSVYFNTRSGRIMVGANTVFGEDVRVLTGKHANLREARQLGVPLHHVPESGRDIVIGRNCYIGTAAIIIGPVTIGDHAVIGAGAVVTHDVEPATFVAGVPAHLVARLDTP